MGYYTTAEIVKIVNKLIDRCGTRDPYKVAVARHAKSEKRKNAE